MSISDKAVTKVLTGALALLSTAIIASNVKAEVIGRIPNTDGSYVFVTNAGCVPAEAKGFTVKWANSNGVIDHLGCLQEMDDKHFVINWNDGTEGVVAMTLVEWNQPTKVQPVATPPAIETKQWMARNPWFNSQEYAEATRRAREIDNQVHAAGYRLGDGKYFDELDRRLLEAGITKPTDPVADAAAENADWAVRSQHAAERSQQNASAPEQDPVMDRDEAAKSLLHLINKMSPNAQ